MKKILKIIIVIVFALLPISTSDVNGQSTYALEIEKFQSNIALDEDGVLSVTEKLTVNFFDDLHGIYRYIPYVYSRDGDEHYSEVSIKRVARDGQDELFEQSTGNGNVELKIGDPDRTINGQHHYTISYTVTGVLLPFEQYDELYWNVTGNDWEIPIRAVQATVTLPEPGIIQTACYVGISGSNQTCQTQNESERVASFSTDSALQPGEGMTLSVGYEKDMVPILRVEKPRSEFDILLERLQHPGVLLIGVASIFGGILVPWWLWYRFGRDWWWKKPELLQETTQLSTLKPWRYKPQVVVEFEPPLDLRPAQVGMLIDQRADTLDVTSTIIDLASRGYLAITEIDKTWVFGSKDYQLDRTNKSDQKLLEYEQELLDSLFGKKKQVKLSNLKNTFYKDLEKVKDLIRRDLMDQDYFVQNPKNVRIRYVAIGTASFSMGVGIAVLSIVLALAWLLALSILPIVAGIGLMIISVSMPQRTAKGYEAYRRVLGYELFISTAEKYRQRFFEDKNVFTQALPYAMVFGLTDKFAKAMEQIEYQPPQPSWYHGAHAFSIASFSQDMGRVSTAFSSTMASTPSSSGSGGGGYSGGGFGGGGGGGW